MSGTTAKTSFTQEQYDELDKDIMLDSLPALSVATDNFLKLLVPADAKSRPIIWKEMKIEGSKHNKLFKNRLGALKIHKDNYGANTEYIQIPVVLRALFGVNAVEDVSHGEWRPDSLLYKANLARLLQSMLVEVHSPPDLSLEDYGALEIAYQAFPTGIAGNTFSNNAFNMSVDLATQLAIARLAIGMPQPHFDPHSSTISTFFTESETGEQVYKYSEALHLDTLNEQSLQSLHGRVAQRVEEMDEPFASGRLSPDAAINALRARFPWDRFLQTLVAYFDSREAELDEEIAIAGGAQAMADALSTEIQNQEEAAEAERKRQSFKAGETPKKAFGKDAMSKLKAREKRLSAAAAANQAAAPTANMTQPTTEQDAVDSNMMTTGGDDGFVRQEDDDFVEPSPSRTAKTALDHLEGVQEMMRRKAKGKGRSFVDAQNNAQRVAWEESQASQYQMPGEGASYRLPGSSAPRPYPMMGRSSGKRAREEDVEEEEEEDFEPTQDAGFQTDTRDMAAANQRRQQAPTSTRARFSSTARSRVSNAAGSAEPSPSKRQRKNPGSALPPPSAALDPEDGSPPPATQFERVKNQAKMNRITHAQSRPPQQRRNWTPEEEGYLVTLIEENCDDSVKYAELKALDAGLDEAQMLRPRSAEDIRFKARNMKLTFLL